LVALCAAAFAGCSSRTDVATTGSTPTQFTHVFITAQAVWFNTNKGAGPDDSGWARFVLKTPVTVDLVQQSNGTLGQIASDLRVPPGTYNSILLLPVDPSSTTLTDSATALGATYNQEADYADASGSHQVRLVLPNWEKGIIAPGSLKVPVGKATTTGIGTGTNNGTSNSAFTLFGSPTTINGSNSNTSNGTNTNATTNTTTNTNTNNTVTVSFGVNFDANRDLHMFNYPAGSTTLTGVLLSASPTASDLSTTGGITGTLSLTSITNVSTNPSIANSASGRTAIQASAELLSADGTHHVIVASAPVSSDGTFTIYPLPSDSKNPTAYDVVIHGPNIATIIIKNVSVTTTTPSITAAASTTGAIATTTATGAVSLGTLIPQAAGSYPVNLTSTVGASLPGGAALIFYQTLPLANEVPYAIDEAGIDPVNHTLVIPEALATNSIYSGTYSSNGGTITLTSSTPVENLGSYKVGVTAPLYTDSVPSSGMVVTGPASALPPPAGTATTPTVSTTPVMIGSVPTLSPANGASASITAAVTDSQGDTAGTLLVSHDGALVAAVDLSQVLKNGGGNVTVNGLPSGSVYYLSVIAYNASQPGAFRYESIASPVSAGATNVTVAIN
jgi:hypothetical protein